VTRNGVAAVTGKTVTVRGSAGNGVRDDTSTRGPSRRHGAGPAGDPGREGQPRTGAGSPRCPRDGWRGCVSAHAEGSVRHWGRLGGERRIGFVTMVRGRLGQEGNCPPSSPEPRCGRRLAYGPGSRALTPTEYKRGMGGGGQQKGRGSQLNRDIRQARGLRTVYREKGDVRWGRRGR